MGKEFKLNGITISFDSARVEYNELRMKFLDVAYKYTNEFIELYKTNKNLDDVHNNAFDQGNRVISKAITNEAIPLLIDKKIYNVNAEKFVDAYADLYIWEDQFRKIDDKYLELVLEKEQMEEYRKKQKRF